MDNMHKQFRNFSRKMKNIALKSNVNARNEKNKKVTKMKYAFLGLMSIFETAEKKQSVKLKSGKLLER